MKILPIINDIQRELERAMYIEEAANNLILHDPVNNFTNKCIFCGELTEGRLPRHKKNCAWTELVKTLKDR